MIELQSFGGRTSGAFASEKRFRFCPAPLEVSSLGLGLCLHARYRVGDSNSCEAPCKGAAFLSSQPGSSTAELLPDLERVTGIEPAGTSLATRGLTKRRHPQTSVPRLGIEPS